MDIAQIKRVAVFVNLYPIFNTRTFIYAYFMGDRNL